MEKQTQFTEEQLATARQHSLRVTALLEQFNVATGKDGSPESFAAQVPILQDLSGALLELEKANPAQTSEKERNAIRAQVMVDDGISTRDNLQGLMMAFAVVGSHAQNRPQQMRTCVVYFPLIAEFAQMYQNELATKN